MIRNILVALVSIGSFALIAGCEMGSGEMASETPTTQPTVSAETRSTSDITRDREMAQDRRIQQFGLEQ
jgi:hypothetical protein